jgi:hypothetical protein
MTTALTTTSQIIRLITSTTAQIDATATFSDFAPPNADLDSQDVTVTTASTTTIVAAPAASTDRLIKSMSFSNVGTSSNLLTVQRFDGTTARRMIEVSLGAGEDLIYADGVWSVLDAAGRVKTNTTKSATLAPSVLTTINTFRSTLASAVAGSEMSLWRSVGFPAQGAIPGAAAICTDATAGAFPLAARSGAQRRLLVQSNVQNSIANQSLLHEDRLGHMGGLSGIVITAQTVNLSIHANIGVSNIAQRIGAADYSEVSWYLEWYTATGATIATATAQVTFNDATTGSVNVWVLGATALPASVAASRRYLLAPTNGKYIRSVETVTLSISTGTAGNFGVTAVRKVFPHLVTVANALQPATPVLGFEPELFDNACLTAGVASSTTTSGVISGSIVQAVA